ncbi:hypothetical protein TMatcc_010034 [Talaromyces marneffei ATCC 18224]|nr:hypothetical protein EYB25_009981 [Talaromyces marneffei]
MFLPKCRWVSQQYWDNANQLAVLMVQKVMNTEEIREGGIDLEPNPEFALQVYSTLPLDSDHTALCGYLRREISSSPSMSFEIYSPQPDVFACVEHQRREIVYRKTKSLGEGFFPGIAKAVPNLLNQLPQGFLFVITSHSYRAGVCAPEYEAETGPLCVNFNSSFPLKTKADEHSRLLSVSPAIGYIPSAVEESDISPEREEIMVRTCRHISCPLHDLNDVLRRSHINDGGFDYGFDDDEGDPDSLSQPPAPEIIESWQLKANSYSHGDFSMQSPVEGAILITPKPANVEPDLQYVIYVSFAHTSSQLLSIAQAFTASIIETLPRGKTIKFEFYSSSQSLSAILASHRDVMNARPELAVGAYNHESQTRIFPKHR